MNITTPDNQVPGCPVCGLGLSIRPAVGRGSGKPFIMLICPRDGRHFRAFITDQEYVAAVTTGLKQLEGQDRNSAGQEQ